MMSIERGRRKVCGVPKVSGKDTAKALQRHGYRLATFKGSHAKFVDQNGHEVVVPMHPVISPGSFLSMAAQAGMEKDEFAVLVLGGHKRTRISGGLTIQGSYLVDQESPGNTSVIVLLAGTGGGGD